MRVFMIAVALALFVSDCPAKVAQTTLKQLTERADIVVVGKVTRVIKIKGIQVAEVEVASTLKGLHYPYLYYLAQPTWICDTTGATVGEETLFFFNQYVFDPKPASMAFVKPSGSEGDYTVESDTISIGEYKEPPGFREEVTALSGTAPFLIVSWSGRGQMPVREVDNQKYVTLWVGDVVLPASIPTMSGPQREYSGFIRSAPLSAILAFVQSRVARPIHTNRAGQKSLPK